MSDLASIPVEAKMSMSSSSSSDECKISMLWNWYTVNSCFISKTWHNRSRGQFAGTCIGVFLMVMGMEWLHRLDYEYTNAIAKRRRAQLLANNHEVESDSSTDEKINNYATEGYLKSTFMPLLETLTHSWYWHFLNKKSGEVYPNALDHFLRSALYTVQWVLSYLIMLLFMYYNGYVIISCLLGAFFGHLLFAYKPICTASSGVAIDQSDARKCCM